MKSTNMNVSMNTSSYNNNGLNTDENETYDELENENNYNVKDVNEIPYQGQIIDLICK